MMRRFDPWIGVNYKDRPHPLGLKLLLLGESHYGDSAKASQDYTTKMIQDYALYRKRKLRFFTIVQRLVTGIRKPTLNERERFWNRVAFYNYIQQFPGTKARIAPTHEMWAKASGPLQETLAQLEPDLVIILGNRLFRHVGYIPHRASFCHVPHPSSRGFKFDQWFPVVQDAMLIGSAIAKRL